MILFVLGCIADRCDDAERLPRSDVLVIGDSVLGWNASQCQSVPDHTGAAIGQRLDNRAVNGALVLGSDGVRSQYADQDWEVVIVDGGANDLNAICECGSCQRILNRLSSEDGTSGAMPALVDRIVDDGASVVLLGYYHVSDQAWYGFHRCTPVITELDRRYAAIAESRPDVVFWDMDNALDPDADDRDYAFDDVHPAPAAAVKLGNGLGPVLDSVLSSR